MADQPADSGSRERVALELAKIIHNYERPAGSAPITNPRKHWLELYAQCWVATRGGIEAPPIT